MHSRGGHGGNGTSWCGSLELQYLLVWHVESCTVGVLGSLTLLGACCGFVGCGQVEHKVRSVLVVDSDDNIVGVVASQCVLVCCPSHQKKAAVCSCG